jgi:hypothetical protein
MCLLFELIKKILNSLFQKVINCAVKVNGEFLDFLKQSHVWALSKGFLSFNGKAPEIEPSVEDDSGA